jgi:hypothetical protein
MVTTASLLLIYLKPAEVYYALEKLLDKSLELLKNDVSANRIHWHFTVDKP